MDCSRQTHRSKYISYFPYVREKYKKEPKIEDWKEFLGRLKSPVDEIDIGLIGKYVELKDSYKSIAESFIHAGAMNECKVNLHWIHAEDIEKENVNKILNPLIPIDPSGK